MVRYQHGLFLPVPGVGSLEKVAQDHKDDGLFPITLDQFQQQSRHVSRRLTSVLRFRSSSDRISNLQIGEVYILETSH